MMELEFFASCLSGLERALADELKSFGIERVRPLGGGVAFFCTQREALRACLWSRLASRIMMVIGRVNAGDADLLYAGVYDISWEDVFAADATFAVRAHGTNDALRNTRFTALKVKDAIVDRMRSKREERPTVDTTAPRTSIDVRIRGNRGTISLDFSGEALNHRAYLTSDDKEDVALACSFAAGMLAACGWSELAAHGAAFVDPACRDGIVLVEAASVACDLAPGLHRDRWGFTGWAEFDSMAWDDLIDEAHERFEARIGCLAGPAALDAPQSAPPDLGRVRFAGVTTSSPMITRARAHVRRAGLRQVVSVELGDAANVSDLVKRVLHVAKRNPISSAYAGNAAPCVVASAIDARSRADSVAYVRADEAAYMAACTAVCKVLAAPGGAAPARSSDAVVLSASAVAGDPGSADFEDVGATVSPISAFEASRFAVAGAQDVSSRFGSAPIECIVAGHGRIETRIEVFAGAPAGGTMIEIADLAGGAPHKVEVLEQSSDQFAARLRKVFKERRKWAAREGVSCYRVYDSDLPDYAVAIDVYTGAGDAKGNTYLHIAEYAPPASVDPERAQRRFSDVLSIAPVVCGVRPDHVFSKTRIREKGGGQYRNAGHRTYATTIEENGYRFEVDLAGRLDTGLFLDHRLTRELIEKKADGARFLNLFAYTGTGTVYAAGGGAKSTTTVDLSQTYLDWARRNMIANGFKGAAHSFERADVIRWITDARRSGKRYDLVFVDPPTFSNSKAMGKRTWDVQRDHVELLIGVSRLLADGGEAIFSCNLRSFKPYVDELAKYDVEIEDISSSTIPEDFARTPKIHKCYLVRHA